jgi:hypothetical protein
VSATPLSPDEPQVALWWIVGVAIQLAFVAALFAFVALAHHVLFTR